jgi:hypothetical protein
MDLCIHSPIRLWRSVFLVKHRDNFTFLPYTEENDRWVFIICTLYLIDGGSNWLRRDGRDTKIARGRCIRAVLYLFVIRDVGESRSI